MQTRHGDTDISIRTDQRSGRFGTRAMCCVEVIAHAQRSWHASSMVRSLGGHAGGNASSMTHDVQNRPAAFRAAATYVLAVVAVAAVAFAVYAFAARESVVAASLVPAILFVGGVGAFLKTYRE